MPITFQLLAEEKNGLCQYLLYNPLIKVLVSNPIIYYIYHNWKHF